MKINLEKSIKDTISMNGPITLDYFLSLVIPYYYNNNDPIGKSGDFITAPEISQLFGEMIGIWVANKWMSMGRPEFSIVELGGGLGTLMQDLLRGTKYISQFHSKMKKIYMVDQSDLLINNQKEKLQDYHDKVEWIQGTEKVNGNEKLFIINNELFDALPIKQFIKCTDGLREMHVLLNEKNHLEIRPYGNAIKDDKLKTGEYLEVSVVGEYIAEQIATLLGKNGGYMLAIDYGYIESTKNNTIQTVRRHKKTNILDNIGYSDITSHVDFKLLAGCFIQHGFKCNITSQANFLINHGIKERVEMLIQQGAEPDKLISQMDRLTSKEQMGELFKVLEIEAKHPPIPYTYKLMI